MRIKRMQVSVILLKDMLAQGNVVPSFAVVSDGIPGDAVVCGVSIPDGRTIEITLQSDTFEEVKEGDLVPFLSPIFETLPRQQSA